MSHIVNYPDGKPGEGGPEAVRQRNNTILAIFEYLDKPKKRIDYALTHGPWNPLTRVCEACNHAEAEIHHLKLVCRRPNDVNVIGD